MESGSWSHSALTHRVTWREAIHISIAPISSATETMTATPPHGQSPSILGNLWKLFQWGSLRKVLSIIFEINDGLPLGLRTTEPRLQFADTCNAKKGNLCAGSSTNHSSASSLLGSLISCLSGWHQPPSLPPSPITNTVSFLYSLSYDSQKVSHHLVQRPSTQMTQGPGKWHKSVNHPGHVERRPPRDDLLHLRGHYFSAPELARSFSLFRGDGNLEFYKKSLNVERLTNF